MLRFALLGLAILLLSGCVSEEEQRARDLAADQQRCNAYGLQPGTSAYVVCMTMAAQQREEQRRNAATISNLNNQINQLSNKQQPPAQATVPASTSSATSGGSPDASMIPKITVPTIPSIDTSGMNCTTTTKTSGNASSVTQSCHN